MKKKDIFFSVLIGVLLILFFWQLLSKGVLLNQLSQLSAQINQLQKYNGQLSFLSGIGPLKSTHIHADVKVYINGQPIDFSQKKYQITTSYIHFEDGLGDVIHVHATGMTTLHLLKSVGMDLRNHCLIFEDNNYCSDAKKEIKFFVNGKESNDLLNDVMKDLDKILVSYGSENNAEVQKQMDSVTNLAQKYSANKQEME